MPVRWKKPKRPKLKRIATAQGIFEIIDNFDRPARAYADGLYADADNYAYAFENEPGKRVPKAGALAEAGVGRAGAQWSIFAVEANGPNAGAEAEANGLEAEVMARAELGSVAAAAGPLKAKLGLGVDTGAVIGPTKIGFKFLGTGLTVGSTMGVSFFGIVELEYSRSRLRPLDRGSTAEVIASLLTEQMSRLELLEPRCHDRSL